MGVQAQLIEEEELEEPEWRLRLRRGKNCESKSEFALYKARAVSPGTRGVCGFGET